MERPIIGAVMLGAACYLGILWVIARILKTCDDEIQTDFEELKARERV